MRFLRFASRRAINDRVRHSKLATKAAQTMVAGSDRVVQAEQGSLPRMPHHRPPRPWVRLLWLVLLLTLTGDVEARVRLSSSSLVPTADWISDTQARLQLAALLADDPAHQIEARSLLERVVVDQPMNLEARSLLSDLLLRIGRAAEAAPHLDHVFAHRDRQPARRPQLAELLIRAGRLAEALIILREATTETSPPPDLLVRRAEVALWTGQLAEARAALDRLAAAPGAQAWKIADLEGQLALQSGDLAKAEAAWTKALGLLNEDARALEKERRSAESRRLRRQLSLVLSWRNQIPRAIPALEAALLDNPGDTEVRRELGRQYLRAADLASAEVTVKPLTAGPAPSAIDLALWGDVCLAQGRVVDFRKAYELALQSQTNGSATPALERRWADALTAAGDHARALPIYRRLAAAAPADLDLGLALAWSLASAERYAEARQVCALLRLRHPAAPRLACLEGRIRLLEKDFAGALAMGATAAAAAPAGSPEAFAARLLQAEAWLGSGHPASAAAALAPLLPRHGRLDDPHPIEVLADLHRLLDLTGPATAARQLLDALEPQRPLHPYLRLARLLARYGDRTPELEQAIARDHQTPPRHLADWGHELMRRHRVSAAEAAFRRALERQPDCLPARLGLVMLLAATERRREALHTLVPPGSAPLDHFLVRLWQARLLAWDGHYAEARQAYRQLRQADPGDPVAQRESARLAFWSRRPDEARALYRSHSRPAADSQIGERLQQHGLNLDLGSALVRPPDWDGWDRLAGLARDSQISSATRMILDEILASTLADARQQKIFDLEERAKRTVWEGRLQASLPLYRQLLQTEPGNFEARFDLSQVQNRLGLRDHEAASYREILRLDPLHSLVRHAQRKHQAVGRPLLRVRFDRWTEEGRGELARMSWWRWRLEGETALGPRWRLGVGQNRWEYHPGLFGGSFRAGGPSLTLRGVFNPWLRLDASWQRQEFSSERRILGQAVPDRDAGQVGLRATVGDRLDLGLGLDRLDQFVNDFGLRDGLQARQRWLSAAWSAHRRFQVQSRVARQDLTDDNHGRLFEWEAGYRLAEHPRLWRLVLSGEARDTDRSSVFITRLGRLADILHPYWTPQAYRSRSFTLHHQADLSKRLLASTDRHQVDVRLTRLDDTDDNRATRLELTWHFEFAWRWAVELRGMVHRSRQWDATSFGFLLERNF